MTAIRHPSLDNDASLPLVCTSYLGHFPSIDGAGAGLAETILKTLKKVGLTEADIRTGLKGANYDGALLYTNVCSVPISFIKYRKIQNRK